MLNEPILTEDSPIRRLDPRVRVVFTTVYSFVVATSNRFPVLLAALGMSVLLAFLARLDIRDVFKRLALVNGLVLLFWLLLPLTFAGTPLFAIGPFTVSLEGVVVSARITLKSNAILLALLMLVASGSVSELGSALNRLGVPPKIVYLFLLTYRYIFVIEQEFQRLVRAAKIRGFHPGTNVHTYRSYAYLIGMLFVRASDRAERVHQAMVCRGFNGRFHCLREFSLSRRDLAWSAILGLAVLGLEIFEWVNLI